MAKVELGRYLRESNQQHHSLLESAVECWLACEMCSDACLGEDDVERMVECIRLDRECAESCQTLARAIVRGSELVPTLARVSAELCHRCADECAQHEADHCQLCAEACRRCANECESVVG